ncbi:MAG TPA: DUF6471 domain-containing protein [Mucilaginibacter sp.]
MLAMQVALWLKTGIFDKIFAYMPVLYHICNMDIHDWQEQAKWLLKSELIRRGLSHDDLVLLLKNIGVDETKASIDSKISRGSFSAIFLLQCLNAIGCESFNPEISTINSLGEPFIPYKTKKNKKKVYQNDNSK